jgi:hypothetical protein
LFVTSLPPGYNDCVIKSEKYLSALSERRTKSRSRVTTRHQMLGLIIAELLEDRPHKALYIKLAKEGDQNRLMEIARDVSERGPVRNKGAYFMTVIESQGLLPKPKPKVKPQPKPAPKKQKKLALKKKIASRPRKKK